MHRLSEHDADVTTLQFLLFNGGFHTILELLKMRGKLFALTHLRQAYKNWRPSEAQLNWVMDPGDPNQADDELIWVHFAMIATCIFEIIELRSASQRRRMRRN
jgi:hypothetical protein